MARSTPLCASRPPRADGVSGEQYRRQPAASVNGRLVGRPPCIEKLDELLPRAVVVPFAIASDDLQQMVDGLLALVVGIERQREIEARLVIERIAGDFFLELAQRPERFRLLRELQRCARG